MWVDSVENVRSKFPESVRFVKWKHVGREIRPLSDLKALFDLMKILRPYRKSDAVVHLHSSKAGFLGRLACRLVGIKRIIYTPHCAAFLRTDISEGKRKLYRRLEKLAGHFGGLVVGCGESEAEIYRDLGLESRAVANGIDPAEGPEPEKATEPLEICFAGIANHQKNPALFAEIAGLCADREDLKFVWVGDGMLRNELEGKGIEICGWQDKEYVQKRLERASVYLSTAGWEGLPFGVIEAMNASCALLLHDVPGNRDCVEEGRNGRLFSSATEAAEILKEICSDPAVCRKMGSAGRKLAAERFSSSSMGEGYRRIYREIEQAGSSRGLG